MEVERDREAAPTWGRAEEELGRGNRAGGGGGGSGDPEDPAAAAADEGEGSLDQTGFLLQRLKDLKRWQKEQEMRLLRDQQRQMEELQRGRRSDEDSPDDDPTIDQDVSSLTSFEELPQSSDNLYSSAFEDASFDSNDDDVDAMVAPRLINDAAVPSWASRTESDPSQDPKTVLSRRPFLSSAASASASASASAGRRRRRGEEETNNELDERPVGNSKSFEQLLAEQLGCDVGALKDEPAFERTAKVQQQEEGGGGGARPKRTFLRKGSGLARYGGVGGAGGTPKALSRSRSQGNVSDKATPNTGRKIKGSTSCSKLDIAERETIAFASKKSPPKRSTSVKSTSSSSTTAAAAAAAAAAAGSTPVAARKVVPAAANHQPSKSVPKAPPAVVRRSGIEDRAVAARLLKGVKKGEVEGVAQKKAQQQQQQQKQQEKQKDPVPVYDSVEWSFREKLKKADKKHELELKDLATFEMLEEAACDSSCSSSSKVRDITGEEATGLPSPIAKPPKKASTPLQNGKSKSDHSEDASIGLSLMNDIQEFLQKRGAVVTKENDELSSDDDDDTLRDEDGSSRPGHGDSGDDGGVCSLNGHLKETSAAGTANGHLTQQQSHRVRFQEEEEEEVGEEREEEEDGEEVELRDFSPPRIPKNSPSYLIWSIFTKEREEREKMRQQQQKSRGQGKRGRGGGRSSPLSQMPLRSLEGGSDLEFESTLLNAKLAELEGEVERFREENAALQSGRRRLQAAKKKLAQEIDAFEATRKEERKQMEEEKRRVKRDRILLEKAQREKSKGDERRVAEDVENLQTKLAKLQEDIQRKESKWSSALTKLQDQVKYLEKENQHLHEENHRLKLKGVSSKISTNLEVPRQIGGAQVIDLKSQGEEEENTEARGQGQQVQQPLPASNGDTAEESEKVSPAPAASVTPRLMVFSPAESLDSNVTLVSGATAAAAAVSAASSKADRNPDAAAAGPTTANAIGYPRLVSSTRNEAKGVTEKTYEDGTVEACYDNGNRKVVSADRRSAKVYYYNGDVKETLPSGLVKYLYSQTKTWHLTYPSRKEVLQFANGQEEVRYPDGSLQISFPDGSLKRISTDGSEEMTFTDGTRVQVEPNGDRTLHLANGEKELHTAQFKRREYPDGTVKTLFNDGRQESRYANGRVRVKDKDGNLFHDSHPDQE